MFLYHTPGGGIDLVCYYYAIIKGKDYVKEHTVKS